MEITGTRGFHGNPTRILAELVGFPEGWKQMLQDSSRNGKKSRRIAAEVKTHLTSNAAAVAASPAGKRTYQEPF